MSREKKLENPNDQAVVQFQAAAKAQLPAGKDPPYLEPSTLLTEKDPAEVLRKGERAKRELEEVESEHQKMIEQDRPTPTPPLPTILLVSGFVDAFWISILEVLLKLAYAAIGMPDAKRLVHHVVSTLADALALANDAYSRTHTAIDGKNPNAPAAIALRTLVFGNRPRPSARDDWKTELELIKSAIGGLDSCPTELSEMLPLLQTALDAVSQAVFGDRGRIATTSVLYSRAALSAVLTVDVALDRLLKGASSRADAKELGKLKSIITPRRKSDQTTTTPNEPPPDNPPPVPEPPPAPAPTTDKAGQPPEAGKPESGSAPKPQTPATNSAPAQPKASTPAKPQTKPAENRSQTRAPVKTRNARAGGRAKKSTRRR